MHWKRAPLVLVLAGALAWLGASCSGSGSSGGSAPASVARITILQINDIYEITPVEGGRSGGLARVATVRERLLDENPNTITVLSGDFFSPSALGTAEVDGKRLAGKQMVAVMNALGLDLATFGNHELDLKRDDFMARMGEGRYQWISANVFDAQGQPFPGVVPHHVIAFEGPGGRPVRIGWFGVTLTKNNPDYVSFTEPLAAAREQVAALKGQVDLIIALTHQSIEQDVELAQSMPEIDLILGGHEHENIEVRRGADFTPVVKADANVRSVYIHDILFDTESGRRQVSSRFLPITDDIPDHPGVKAVVDEWVEKGFAGFRAQGFDPEAVVTTTDEPLDGREATVRNQPTRLTELIAQAMLSAVPDAQLSLYNSGSIRIDDVLPPGPLTQYDVLRVLPFGGTVVAAEIQGRVLAQALDVGESSRGSGAYLQYAGVSKEGGSWRVGDQPLQTGRTYLVAISDFLAAGREQGMDFLSPDNPGLSIEGEHGDVRQVLIDELRRQYGAPPESAGSGAGDATPAAPAAGDEAGAPPAP